MLENIFTLLMLILLQAVLGFDNLLYISLESKNAPKEKQAYVRKVGILLAIVLRIALLFILISLIDYFQDPVISLPFSGVAEGQFNIHSLIVLAGGIFIIYTAMKEIWHMVGVHEVDADIQHRGKGSVTKVITMIIIMNLVFSFDSILSAMALTNVFWVMATAIIIGGLLMIWLADRVANFLQKNRMYEVLGLFILFIVGIMLLTEGGHLAHLKLFDNEITPMSKTTFYFVIAILVVTDLVQSKYQKKLIAEQEHHSSEKEDA
ncbi:MAG: tellurium resistance protein TerC [Bacteroidia bacterium]|nr:tellurium resistance protein TerC [Bacteroidia bacterium]NNF82217.1 tellurium resistance protein TerC [Flavobacteriaceae bacterium]NNL79292.1 tellurium resistance protein TerC [Flavobacteriaceae bacterium]